jgi:demethylmenaquinone methyltransferase/2-methoxy-6-polyprenyl-1,4-benzoquinol methylase
MQRDFHHGLLARAAPDPRVWTDDGEARVTGPVSTDKAPDRIAGMFDAIAPRYDLLNHLLSAGIDRRWRSRAIRALSFTGTETLIDVCSGTGDVALAAVAGGARRVIGVDFAGAMLALGMGKVRDAGAARRIAMVRGDAMSLPVPDGCADAVTVAFGIRNVQRPEAACAEMARVLKRDGKLAILEFSVPRLPGLSGLYQWYFTRVLPFIGRLISGHTAAYSYLPASVGTFAPPAEFMDLLRRCGFTDVTAVPLTLGIVQLYTARKPGS